MGNEIYVFLIVFMFMLFMHGIADFNLQGCLADLKQKSWWKNFFILDDNKLYRTRFDYMAALAIHSFTWSVCIMIPLVVCFELTPGMFVWLTFINTVVHAIVDNAKCNKYNLNLIEDQLVHVIQMLVTLGVVGNSVEYNYNVFNLFM